ncbi:MAG: cupin domain-containing protein [Lachnospiraceae bacterium]|nr:cupin domain-containing protein [Lachnospiraceae bacterium]
MIKGAHVNQVVTMSNEMIADSLENTERQYLQGNLKQEQKLPFIYNENSEIGISYYREFTHDEAHYHDVITETNYILEGRLCLKIVDTGEEFIIEKGGIFSVPPKVTHILKVYPGTKIIFFKDHSINDKHVVDLNTLQLEEWLANKEF